MKLIVVESPYGSDDPKIVLRNVRYLRACMNYCLTELGMAPYASHGLYTQPGVLRDPTPEERKLGLEAGDAWSRMAQVRGFFLDLGETEGMTIRRDDVERYGQEFLEVHLGEDWEEKWLGPSKDELWGVPEWVLLACRIEGQLFRYRYDPPQLHPDRALVYKNPTELDDLGTMYDQLTRFELRDERTGEVTDLRDRVVRDGNDES